MPDATPKRDALRLRMLEMTCLFLLLLLTRERKGKRCVGEWGMKRRFWNCEGRVGEKGDGYLVVVLDAFLHDGMNCELTLVDHGGGSDG